MSDTPAKTVGPLTDKARFAAFMDARGFSIQQIAESVNVHPGTVTNWRAREDYVALRRERASEVEGKLEAIITDARLEMLALHRKTGEVFAKGLARIEEMLEATMPDSTAPNYVVQIEALKLLQKMLAAPSPLIAKAIAAAEELNGQLPAGPSVVQLQINVVAGAADEHEGEVVEDGDWQADQNGDSAADQAALDAGGDAGGAAGEGAGTSGEVVLLPDCTCSNPTAWLEASCPLHGDEVRERLAAGGLDVAE